MVGSGGNLGTQFPSRIRVDDRSIVLSTSPRAASASLEHHRRLYLPNAAERERQPACRHGSFVPEESSQVVEHVGSTLQPELRSIRHQAARPPDSGPFVALWLLACDKYENPKCRCEVDRGQLLRGKTYELERAISKRAVEACDGRALSGQNERMFA